MAITSHAAADMRSNLISEAVARGFFDAEIANHALVAYDLIDLRKCLVECTPEFNWDWAYLRHVQKVLASISPQVRRMIAFEMPIRHGKSEQITKHYQVARLKADPKTRCAVACHTAELAGKFSREMRRMALRVGVQLSERKAERDWETAAGGGVHAVGVGGPLAGYGFNIIGIDDPIKNREQAESLIYRDKTWDWLNDDVLTRMEPGCSVTFVGSRWHEDDVIGRIKMSDQANKWEFVFLPALAEEDDLVGRSLKEPLCPDRYDREYLENERLRMGDYSFSGLYQQRPTPRDGAMFNVSKLTVMSDDDVRRIVFPPGKPGLKAAIGTDLGATVGGDETTMVLIAGPCADKRWYIVDVLHGDWEPAERNERMDSFVAQYEATGDHRVSIVLPQDPGQAGKDQARQLASRYPRYRVVITRPTGSKASRADGFASQVNASNVCIVRAEWTRFVTNQMQSFPLGVHDDIIDAQSDGYNELTKRRTVAMTFY